MNVYHHWNRSMSPEYSTRHDPPCHAAHTTQHRRPRLRRTGMVRVLR